MRHSTSCKLVELLHHPYNAPGWKIFKLPSQPFPQKRVNTVLCTSNASEMSEFRYLFTRTFQESSRKSSSDNSRPFERSFPRTKGFEQISHKQLFKDKQRSKAEKVLQREC